MAPNTRLAVGEKLLLFAAHRTVQWCTRQSSGAPDSLVRLAVGSDTTGDRWCAGFLHRTLRASHRTVRWLLSTSATGLFPGAPDSLTCGTGQSGAPDQTVRRQHFVSWTSLDLHNVFF
jgi:hypothetical protein